MSAFKYVIAIIVQFLLSILVLVCFFFSVVGISFVQNEYSVIENAGNVDLLVSRTVASSIEVELQIIPQTAVGMSYKMKRQRIETLVYVVF